MPRTVLAAVLGVGLYGLLSLAALPHAELELEGLSGKPLLAQVVSALSLTFGAVSAFGTARGLARRRERARAAAFAVGLGLALVLAILGLTLLVVVLANGGAAWIDAVIGAVAFVLVVGPPAAVAWSLSRPSAKAWFASAPPGPRAGPRLEAPSERDS